MKIRKMLYVLALFWCSLPFAQDHYEQKLTLGSSSGGKWYKLATINLQGSYNSVIIDVDVYYVNTWTRYAAKAYIRLREGPTSSGGDWQSNNRGVNTEVLKFKKLGTKTYELWGYSNGGYGHISTLATVVKESSTLNFALSSTPTVITDPNAFEDVSQKGEWFFSDGKVLVDTSIGIGTTDPGPYKLAVNGNVHAKEVKVDLVGWPDYVLKEGYDLPSLEEVEQHILEKGHLINIPSANEVAENGIQLGEMNKLLLEKIEELTLYVIDLKKENKRLREDALDAAHLDERVKQLETVIKKLKL